MNLRTRPKLNYLIPIVFPTPAKCVKLRSLESCVPSKGDLKYRKSTVLHLQKMYGKYKLLPQVKFLTVDLERMLQVRDDALRSPPHPYVAVGCLACRDGKVALVNMGANRGKQVRS